MAPRRPTQQAGVLDLAEVERAVQTLPAAQRAVLVLRDLEGLSAVETCQLLDLTEGNQHRARAKVRAALERYLDPTPWRS